jgi:hypothetical protein
MSEKKISIHTARCLAEIVGHREWGGFMSDRATSPLRDHYYKEDNCWVFLRNRSIVVPEEYWSQKSRAIVITEFGSVFYFSIDSDAEDGDLVTVARCRKASKCLANGETTGTPWFRYTELMGLPEYRDLLIHAKF